MLNLPAAPNSDTAVSTGWFNTESLGMRWGVDRAECMMYNTTRFKPFICNLNTLPSA